MCAVTFKQTTAGVGAAAEDTPGTAVHMATVAPETITNAIATRLIRTCEHDLGLVRTRRYGEGNVAVGGNGVPRAGPG